MSPRLDDIAIVGMGCRFPGASGLSAYWELLAAGRESVGDIPADRWDVDQLFHPDPATPGKMTSRRGGFVDHVHEFDPLFFGISPREAPHVDPRQRIVLEVAWEALEHAGIVPAALAGTRAGVFIATLTNDYDALLCADLARIDVFTGAGTANSIIANRLSYFLDLRGPSLSIDTACSGSLVAIHLAVDSLRRGESTLAIAGGVSINLRPKSNVFFSKAGIISPQGHCRTFAASADGIVRSDGAGILILKPLADAVRDGDRVVAVITGTATNHGGRSNGIMAPNPAAQAAVIAEAYRRAGVAPGSVQYIEAHGTGTRLGDPIEVQGMASALDGRAVDDPCLIGSVKSNIGHTEPASGVAGVIKVVLSMEHRQLPASLHVDATNPLIPFETLPIRVQTRLTPWPRPDAPLIAGVSGFGFGGSNAHVVIEEPPQDEAARNDAVQWPLLLPLSARTPAALRDHAVAHRDWLARQPTGSIADICYTAAVRRTHHQHRLTVSGTNAQEMIAALDQWLSTHDGHDSHMSASRPGLVFVCSGQGSHWPRMGAELYQAEPVFRNAIDACERALSPHVKWSLVEELLRDAGASRLDETQVTQPAIFAVQIALVELWRSWGVTPSAIVGQSLGEVAAAVSAGALSLDDGAAVVAHRSRLMQRAAGSGRTAAVGLGFDAARAFVRQQASGLAVAGSNSPTTSVLSGTADAVDRAVAALDASGVFARVLPGVDVAFHSPQMDPLVPELIAALSGIVPRRAAVPLWSTITGVPIEGSELTPAYWGRNLREPFLFAATAERMLNEGASSFLEVSPHPVLSSAIVQTARHSARAGISVVSSLRRSERERAALLGSLAGLYGLGHEIHWREVLPFGRVVSLPPYPWQRQRYWFDQLSGSRGDTAPRKRAGDHPLIGERIEPALSQAEDGSPSAALWEIDFEEQRPRYFADHRVLGDVVVSGAALLEMSQAAGRQALAVIAPAGASVADEVCVDEMSFEQPIRISSGERVRVQLTLTATGDGRGSIAVFSRPSGDSGAGQAWRRHASATISAHLAADRTADSLSDIRSRCVNVVDVEAHYAAMKAEGLGYGPAFRCITAIAVGHGEALTAVTLPASLSDQGYLVHPSLLDAAFQSVAVAVSTISAGGDAYLPSAISGWRIHTPAPRRLLVHARVLAEPGSQVRARLTLYDEDGAVAAELSELTLARRARTSAMPLADAMLTIDWETKPPASPAVAGGRFLIVADREGVAGALEQRLIGDGATVTVVDSDADITSAIRHGHAPWTGVIHLGGLDAARADEAVSRVCAPALHIVQVLAASVPARVWLAARSYSAAQGSLAGLALSVAQEHPELACTLVELPGSVDSERDAHTIASELTPDCRESRVRWAEGVRYVPRLVPAASVAPAGPPPTLRADATYLVTGAFGALGRHTARMLVDRGARHLVLTGRRGADGSEAFVAQLETAGATIVPAAIDVSQAPEVDRLFNQVLASLPPLAGVVHSAGVLDDALLTQLSPARFEQVMAPKLHAAWLLHEATAATPLDFFILFSSVASLVGSPGQANYAAANASLDALAAYRRERGLPALSVNWGAWAESGMAADAAIRDRMIARGVRPILPADGVAWLSTMLRPDVLVSQIGVMPVDWPMFLRQFADVPALFERFAGGRAAEDGVSMRAAIAEAGATERPGLVRGRVRSEITAVLGLDASTAIGGRDRLFELGMDSLMAVELRNRLQAVFDLPLPATIAFDCPTLDALGAHITSAIGASEPAAAPSSLAALSDDEIAQLLTEELRD